MKIIPFTITTLFLGLFLNSCEGPFHIQLTVVDKITKKPLDSVFVQVKTTTKNGQIQQQFSTYTDSTGKLREDGYKMVGFFSPHEDYHLEYDKKGYTHKVEMNKTDGLVELEH
jgi:hypothetical protein